MLTKGGQYKYLILQSAAVATGNGTVVVPTDADGGALELLTLQIVGITTATITWEASIDGTNYVAVNARNVNSQVVATTATADGLYRVNVTGYFSFRARISAWTTGTIYVYGVCSAFGDAGVGATDASLTTTNTEIGGLTETAPATDTASSGLNGRLQRIAQRITSLIALFPTALNQGTMAQSLRVVVASDQTAVSVTPTAGELHVGQVGTDDNVVDITCTLDTSAYASGDLLFDTQTAALSARVNAGTMVLESVTVLDEDDQGVAFDLYFLDAANTMGSENSAPSISDANARAILGFVPIAAGDYRDLGGCRVACVRGIGLSMKAGAGTTSLNVAGVNGTGTPTFTANGLRLKLGFLRS